MLVPITAKLLESREIAPEVRHPVFKRTVRELRDSLPPGQAVRRIPTT